MHSKLVACLGAAIGLLVSGSVLALMWFGVSGVLRTGNTDLMYVFWPSSVVSRRMAHYSARNSYHNFLGCNELLDVFRNRTSVARGCFVNC
jgi:hypothetical protein